MKKGATDALGSTNCRVLVLRAAGTNCDEETAFAFQSAGAQVERVHVGALLRGERQLDEFSILVIPGGFSYGDDLGAGTVLANQLEARLGAALQEFVASGRLVLGICNGFQVLVRLGLLPGWDDEEKALSLVVNDSGKFEDRWVHLRIDAPHCPFLSASDDAACPDVIRLPVAHKEGRFVVRDAGVVERLRAGGQIAVTYVQPADGPTVRGATASGPESYPANPNGSLEGIAGITNPRGNVLGLMPHPERFLRLLHDPQWTRRRALHGLGDDEATAGDGFRFFDSAVRHVGSVL